MKLQKTKLEKIAKFRQLWAFQHSRQGGENSFHDVQKIRSANAIVEVEIHIIVVLVS